MVDIKKQGTPHHKEKKIMKYVVVYCKLMEFISTYIECNKILTSGNFENYRVQFVFQRL